MQVVLPGAIDTEFWDRAGLPVKNLPEAMVMSANELVDAALAGLDQGEIVTRPSLPDRADWRTLVAARLALAPNLSRKHVASHYLALARKSTARDQPHRTDRAQLAQPDRLAGLTRSEFVIRLLPSARRRRSWSECPTLAPPR